MSLLETSERVRMVLDTLVGPRLKKPEASLLGYEVVATKMEARETPYEAVATKMEARTPFYFLFFKSCLDNTDVRVVASVGGLCSRDLAGISRGGSDL
jgi:hypothetical protein